MDFTLKKYSSLLQALLKAGYRILPCIEYSQDRDTVFLRHDVDMRPRNSLATAQLENSLGIRATYYFRTGWDEAIVWQIVALGHEIGYHYESLTTCRGNVDAAFEDFCTNLERLRELAPVRTICMHGSPRSPWDSRDIWKRYSYRDVGIVFEPYLDTDWGSTLYLTDTGRRWDGFKVSVRDRIPGHQDRWIAEGLVYHSTDDIIAAASDGTLPSRIMITTHPQRWTSSPLPWIRELLTQKTKNIVKFLLASKRRKNCSKLC